jgi:hypothetical protein
MRRFFISNGVAAGVVLALLTASAQAQTPDPFQSAPGPAPVVRPAPRPRPPAAEPQAQAPPAPTLEAAYAARVQQVAQAAGIGMAGALNFRRETTPPQWQGFVGAWGPADRLNSEQSFGQQNLVVIEAINADGFADVVVGWSACNPQKGCSPAAPSGWRRTSGMISGNAIITEETSPDRGRTRREIELSSDGNLHVTFRSSSAIVQETAPRVK